MATKQLRFAILARVSTKPQEKGESLDVQEDRGRAYVARAGGTVAEVYRGVESATKAHEDRALLQRVIHDARAGRFDALWVLDKSRLSRSAGTTEAIAAVFGAVGCALHTAQGAVDLGLSEGEFLAIVEAAADRLTSRRTRERTRQGREKLLGEGTHACQ